MWLEAFSVDERNKMAAEQEWKRGCWLKLLTVISV